MCWSASAGGRRKSLLVIFIERLSYRLAVHGIGAALGFITGDQIAIPDWADRFYLGWLLRFLAQPRLFAPRVPRKVIFIVNGKLAPAVGFEATIPRPRDYSRTCEIGLSFCRSHRRLFGFSVYSPPSAHRRRTALRSSKERATGLSLLSISTDRCCAVGPCALRHRSFQYRICHRHFAGRRRRNS